MTDKPIYDGETDPKDTIAWLQVVNMAAGNLKLGSLVGEANLILDRLNDEAKERLDAYHEEVKEWEAAEAATKAEEAEAAKAEDKPAVTKEKLNA